MYRIFCAFLAIINLPLFAQEICDNGIDDDGDGFVDCFDGECSNENNCEDFYFGNSISCSYFGEFSEIETALQWESENETAASYTSPVIGDLNGDRIPEIVSTNSFSKSIHVLDGRSGEIIASISLSFIPTNTPAIADTDGDGVSEIVVNELNGASISSFIPELDEGKLTLKWSIKSSLDQSTGTIGVADFNKDGTTEIYYRNEIINASTGEILISGNGDWKQDWVHTPLAIDVLNDAECQNCSGLELVTGNEVWAVNLTTGSLTLAADLNDVIASQTNASLSYFPKYHFEEDTQWSAISSVDYNLDGNLDLILTGSIAYSFEESEGNASVILWDVANASSSIFDALDGADGIGKVTLADISNNGSPNAIFASGNKLYALTNEFQLYWVYETEHSSAVNTSTVFDLNGDDLKEVIYKDQENLLILDGMGNGDGTTTLLEAIPCKSASREETPIVADVDFDGSAEICVACLSDDSQSTAPLINNNFGQIRVYESNLVGWTSARSVWNQLNYFNVNINEDLTIPREIQHHSTVFSVANTCLSYDGSSISFPARPLNTFGIQSTPLDEEGCIVNPAADLDFVSILRVSGAACILRQVEVQFSITNIGDRNISGSIPISYYAGDPTTTDGIFLRTYATDIGLLEIGEVKQITHSIDGFTSEFSLFAALNQDEIGTLSLPLSPASILECDLQNNIANTDVRYTDNSLEVTICEGDTYMFGSQVLSEEGMYTETFDEESIDCQEVTLNLSVQAPTTYEQTIEICEGEVFEFGSQSLTASGSYSESFASTNACDSVVNLELVVNEINTNITLLEGTLSVEESLNATYQWVNCEVEEDLELNKTRSFKPTQSGTYAVIIDNQTCRVLSECIDVTVEVELGVSELNRGVIYPNPVREILNIREIPNLQSYQIMSLSGQTIKKGRLNDPGEKLNLVALKKGVYLLILTDSNSNTYCHKLLKD